jgi:hypothetical protein
LSDLTLAIHGLAGHSNSADSIGRFAADDLIYFSVLVVAWLVVGHRSIRMPLVVMVSAAIAVGVAAMIGLGNDPTMADPLKKLYTIDSLVPATDKDYDNLREVIRTVNPALLT